MPDALSERDIREAPQGEIESVSETEAIELGAKSGMFFNRFFLPESFGLAPSDIHYPLIKILDNPEIQHKALCVHRDGAKTTLARARALKKICYGLSQTGLIVSDTKPHARNTINWISRKARFNKRIRTVFGLKIGEKDNADHVQIINSLLDTVSNYQAQGMTGQLRGLNLDDYRPDYILCDDPCNEENTATDDQLEKISGLFFGALMNTLAARTISPLSEMVLLQTPLSGGDLIDLACKDSTFLHARFSVLNEDGESTWKSKWSTKELLKKKQGSIDRNQLHIWLREWEVRLTHASINAFKAEWIDVFSDMDKVPEGVVWFLACDPVPPPKDNAVRKTLYKGDYEVWTVLGVDPKGEYWIVASERNRGHKPDWSSFTFAQLLLKWNPLAVGIETTLYQRTLSTIIRDKMQEIRHFCRIHEVDDKRPKFNRILDTWTDNAFHGKIHIHSSLGHLIEQYGEYPFTSKDDDIDSATTGIMTADACYGGTVEGILDMALEHKLYPPLNVPEEMLCP